MKFDTIKNGAVSPFLLVEGMQLERWAHCALKHYVRSLVSGHDVSYTVLVVMDDADFYYAFTDVASGEIWTVQIMSNGQVIMFDTAANEAVAIQILANIIITDLE